MKSSAGFRSEYTALAEPEVLDPEVKPRRTGTQRFLAELKRLDEEEAEARLAKDLRDQLEIDRQEQEKRKATQAKIVIAKSAKWNT